MLPKAPHFSLGQSGIDAYRARLHDHASVLRNRLDREFYRKELESRAKRYSTLARQRPFGSVAALHFADLARLHLEELESFGSEPAPKPRLNKLAPVPLTYPCLPDECTYRIHFLENGSLRRERSAALAKYADALSSQRAPNGNVLLSVAVHPSRGQFFERLVESIGAAGLGPRPGKEGSFLGYITAEGKLSNMPGWEDESSPWQRVRNDNFHASLYHWSSRRGQLDPSVLIPDDFPVIPNGFPWDPDHRFNEILSLTQSDCLAEAMELVDRIPSHDREVLFDEIIYLRYLLGQPLRGDDLRYLARRYITGSSIGVRLEEEFEDFIAFLDQVLIDAGPIPDDFPGLGSMHNVSVCRSHLPSDHGNCFHRRVQIPRR